jgi:hypothetical protein
MFGFTTKPTVNNTSDKAASVVQAPTATTSDTINKETTVVVDFPSAAPHDDKSKTPSAKMTTTLLDTESAYADLQDEQTMVDPLDTSLHTTCSDASIDLEMFLAAAKSMEDNKEENQTSEDNDNLSFQVSHMDSSDLKEDSTLGLEDANSGDEKKTLNEQGDEKVQQQGPGSTDEATPNFDTMVHISQQLLKTDQDNHTNTKEEIKKSSLLARYKMWVLLALVLGAAARGMNQWLFTTASSPGAANITSPQQQIVILEDESKLMVGDFTFRKETLNSNKSDHWSFGIWKFALFGMITKLAFSDKTSGNRSADENSQTDIDQDNASEAGSDASSVMIDQQEEDISENDSVPSLIPIKLEEDDSIVPTYDLSKYETLKVVELRALLRSRKCSYAGRKVHLIHRLATVYRAELQSLAVVQLRKKLKSRSMKQGGLKRELVQKLVEAGL